VKQALFEAGAGLIGNYDYCCWQVLGEGQFRPLDGASPALGEHGRVENVAEYRVEMVVTEALLKPVLHALKQAHPYEQPAYGVSQLLDV
jgi:hypothetical protein